MPNVVRMFRESNDELLEEVEAPGEGTYDPAALFDMSALDEVDVYFELATAPTAAYTTPAFVAPTITSIFIVLDEDETDTPITEATVGQVVRMVVQATGNPAPSITERAWERDGTPIGGATSATYTVHEDDVGEDFLTAWAKVENAAGEDDDDSAAVTVVADAPAWTPADLFDGTGASGAYFEAATDAMSQEIDATTTPADDHGDPVGTVVMTIGSVTPPIYLRTQLFDTRRPLRWEGGEAVALDFDGTNAQYLWSVPIGAFETGWHLFVACWAPDSLTGLHSVVAVGPQADFPTNYFSLNRAAGTDNKPHVSSNVSPHGLVQRYASTNGTSPANTNVVLGAYLGIGSYKAWVNNSPITLEGSAANSWTGSESVANACLRFDPATGGIPHGRVYAALAYKPADRAEMSSDLRTQIYDYLLGTFPA